MANKTLAYFEIQQSINKDFENLTKTSDYIMVIWSSKGQEYDISEEFNEIRDKQKAKMAKEDLDQSCCKNVKVLFSAAFWRPFSIIGVLYILNELHGFVCVMVYMDTLLTKTNSRLDLTIVPGTLATIRIITALLVPLIIRKISPKALFVAWSLVSSLAMIFLGILSHLNTLDLEPM